MTLPDRDRRSTIDRYDARYAEFGYDPKTLGWDKGKQELRFEVLTSQYDFAERTVVDIGCGFGDLNHHLRGRYGDGYRYVGIDLVDSLVQDGRRRYERPGVEFLVGDFLSLERADGFDYAVASGIFNHRLEAMDNYEYIEAVLSRAFALCRDGLAFDFLSDKVDYPLEHTFHSNPERVLGMAYGLTRNVVLRNDYMPFEFTLFLFKDDSFSPEDTTFTRYERLRAGPGPPRPEVS